MDVRTCFKSEKPNILFVTNGSDKVAMYFDDDGEYVELLVECKYSYGWGSSGSVVSVEVARSETFDFEINPLGQFFVVDDKALVFGKTANYNRGNLSVAPHETNTNLFVISDKSFGLTDKLKNVLHPELIDKLPDDVAEALLANSQFSEIEKYEREIVVQLAS